jgi:hypothetical protein
MPPRHAQVAPDGLGGIWRILTPRRLRGDYAETTRRQTQTNYSSSGPVTIDDLNYAHIVTYAPKNHPFCML